MSQEVTVAEAIKQLRMQLEDAQREGIGKELRFLARSVEVELAIVFKSEVEGGAGVKPGSSTFLERRRPPTKKLIG